MLSTSHIDALAARLLKAPVGRLAKKADSIKRLARAIEAEIGDAERAIALANEAAETSLASEAIALLDEALAPAPVDEAPAPTGLDRGWFRDGETVDRVVESAFRDCGPSKVGAVRAKMVADDPAGFGKLTDTQRKGVIRKSVNRLVKAGTLSRTDSVFSLVEATNRPGDMAFEYAEEAGISYSEALVACNMD